MFSPKVKKFIPHAESIFASFKGTDKTNIYDRNDVKDDLLTQFNGAVAFLKETFKVRSEIRGFYRFDIYEIPLDALREAVVNAIVHRDYAVKGTSIYVRIFDDRVEIENPGGLPDGITKRDFGKSSVRRNPIIADLFHDKFQEIIDAANQPGSIIKRQNIIEINPQEIGQQKEIITFISNIEQRFDEEQKKIELIAEPEQKQKAQINLELRKTILSTLPELNNAVINVNELTMPEIKQIAVEKIKQKIYSTPQKKLFAADMLKEVETAYETVVHDFVQNIIEIPRITIQQSNDVRSGFKAFDLDTRNLNNQPVSEEILVKKLREQENSVDIISRKGRGIHDSPENIIVNELMNYPEIDYDEQSDLLFKLTDQAIEKFRTYLDDDRLMNVVQFHKKEIGSYIYSQMMQHFYFEAPSYEKPVVKPFTRIEEHNFSKYTKDSIYHFSGTITSTNAIPNKIFSGFKKACHNLYKFDSKTEIEI
ncbi:ATP-binding protein [Candidatus Kuenenia sp.]|uniref:ATP-binding protein n=1 Tax=Candidatus Kuenenia sp. TaxID=2499824 RepID=UPI00321FBF1C